MYSVANVWDPSISRAVVTVKNQAVGDFQNITEAFRAAKRRARWPSTELVLEPVAHEVVGG